MNIFKLLFTLSLACAALTSCVDSGFGGGYRSSVGGFGIYDTIPDSYVGSAYRYQNRFYYGGLYQLGSYRYHNRQYSSRYYHNGNYYYGGRHEQHGNHTSTRPGNRDHRSDDRGRIHGSADGRGRSQQRSSTRSQGRGADSTRSKH